MRAKTHTFVYETENFIVETFSKETPHVSREEGGHLRIVPKVRYENRWDMPPKLAIEFMRLSMIVGEALKTAMNNLGVPVVRINYMDAGNWAVKHGNQPYFHMNVYGRASNAVHQPWPEAVYLPDRSSGFMDNFVPLNDEDIAEIQKQIEIISQREEYGESNWVR